MARGGRGSTTTSSRGGVFGRSSASSAPAPAPARAAPAAAPKPQAQAPPQQAPPMQQPTSSGPGFFGTLAASVRFLSIIMIDSTFLDSNGGQKPFRYEVTSAWILAT